MYMLWVCWGCSKLLKVPHSMATSLGSTRQDRKKVADTSERDICDQIERVRRWRDKILLPATIYSLEISVEVEL